MSAMLLDLPDELRRAVAGAAAACGVSEAEWLTEAAREKLAAAAQLAYLSERANRGDRAAFEQVLGHVPAAPVEPGDER